MAGNGIVVEEEGVPPSSGFDTEWVLNTEGPLPVPVAMYSNRFVGGDTWFDLSGRGNHGAITGATWAARERGPVFNCGTSAEAKYANLGADLTASISGATTTPFTACAWAYPLTTTADQAVFASWKAFDTDFDFMLWLDTDGGGDGWAAVLMNNAHGFHIVGTDNSDAVANAWQHVGIRFDGDRLSVFVNGMETDFETSSTRHADGHSTGNVWIGADEAAAKNFGGYISDAVIFDRAISDAEYWNLYQSQLPGGPGVLGASTREKFIPSAAPVVNIGILSDVEVYEDVQPDSVFDTEWVLNTEGPLPVPVALYSNKFVNGGTWFDLSGNDSHGVITGAVWDMSSRGPVLEFTKDAGNFVAITGLSKFSGQNYTIAGWIRIDSMDSAGTILFTTTNGIGSPQYLQFGDSIRPYRVYFQGGSLDPTTVNPWADGIWRHVVITFSDAPLQSLYINGVYDGGEVWPTTNGYVAGPKDWLIGNYSTPTFEFDGGMSDLSFFAKTFSAGEVTALYASQKYGGPGILAQSTREAKFSPYDTLERYWVGS